MIALLAICLSAQLRAQEPVGLHINALTSAERDSISRQMPGTEGLHVIYACVPAGILVLGSDSNISRADLRSQAIQALQPVLGAGRIEDGTLTLHDAEQACENVRGQ